MCECVYLHFMFPSIYLHLCAFNQILVEGTDKYIKNSLIAHLVQFINISVRERHSLVDNSLSVCK